MFVVNWSQQCVKCQAMPVFSYREGHGRRTAIRRTRSVCSRFPQGPTQAAYNRGTGWVVDVLVFPVRGLPLHGPTCNSCGLMRRGQGITSTRDDEGLGRAGGVVNFLGIPGYWACMKHWRRTVSGSFPRSTTAGWSHGQCCGLMVCGWGWVPSCWLP